MRSEKIIIINGEILRFNLRSYTMNSRLKKLREKNKKRLLKSKRK